MAATTPRKTTARKTAPSKAAPRKTAARNTAAPTAVVVDAELAEDVAETVATETAPPAAAPRRRTGPKPGSRLAQLEAEAMADYVPAEPYVLGVDDGFDPPLVITEPVEYARLMGMVDIATSNDPLGFDDAIRALAGDGADRLLNYLSGRHFAITSRLLADIQSHFTEQRRALAAAEH